MFQHIAILPGKTLDLEKLYVEQEFKLIDQDRETEAKGKSGEQSSKATVADIFTKCDKICKNILISGEPGLGKSTFCKHLVRLWCKAYALDDATLTEDQKTLKRFELLFYIDLRDATIEQKAPTSDEIADLIHKLLDLTDTCSVADIRKVLSETSALVVMDSLDELGSSRRPKSGIHNKSCIVTTSRPLEIESLRSQLTDVDQHIEIVGLAETSLTSLANNVLELLNTGSDESLTKTGDEFIQEMDKKELRHYFNTPLLVIQMLGLWFSEESFGSSQFEIYSQIIHHQICAAVKNKLLPKDVISGSKQNVPFCNKTDKCPCRYYEQLLWKVAQLAYHTLFDKKGQMCLVFDITEFHGLSTEEFKLCQKIGIVTQRIYNSKPTDEHKYVSFPHKTNQEYFASIFLSHEGQKSDIPSVISDLGRALELDKVLLFCSHLDLINKTNVTRQLSHSESSISANEDTDRGNPGAAQQLSRLISERADNTPSVQEYRLSCDIYKDAPHADLIQKIQNIIIPATQQNTALFLSDIIVYNPPWRFANQDRNIDVRRLDLTGVKSVHLEFPVISSYEFETLELCQKLEKLVLIDSGIQVKNIHKMVARNQATLKTLRLGGDRYGEPLDMWPLGGEWREFLTSNLVSLGLYCVKLSHEQCQNFCTFVSASRCFFAYGLRQLNLEDVSCETHGISEKCLELDFASHRHLHTVKLSLLPVSKINLKLNTNLHTVKLSHLPVEDVTLDPQTLQKCELNLPGSLSAQTSTMEQLESARNLQELTCGNIQVLENFKVLQNLHSLQRIVLSDVDFGCSRVVSLSAKMEKLEYVQLNWCTITGAGLRFLINGLPRNKVKVELIDVIITDDDNILEDIKNSPNTNITMDEVYQNAFALGFTFDNNNQQGQD